MGVTGVGQNHGRQTAGCGNRLAVRGRRRLSLRGQQAPRCMPVSRLTDEDRKPWLATLHQLLLGWYEAGIERHPGLLCLESKATAMRSHHRYRRDQRSLHPARSLAARCSKSASRKRKNHYMNPGPLAEPIGHPRNHPRSHARSVPKVPRRKIVEEILDKILTVEGKIYCLELVKIKPMSRQLFPLTQTTPRSAVPRSSADRWSSSRKLSPRPATGFAYERNQGRGDPDAPTHGGINQQR